MQRYLSEPRGDLPFPAICPVRRSAPALTRPTPPGVCAACLRRAVTSTQIVPARVRSAGMQVIANDVRHVTPVRKTQCMLQRRCAELVTCPPHHAILAQSPRETVEPYSRTQMNLSQIGTFSKIAAASTRWYATAFFSVVSSRAPPAVRVSTNTAPDLVLRIMIVICATFIPALRLCWRSLSFDNDAVAYIILSEF